MLKRIAQAIGGLVALCLFAVVGIFVNDTIRGSEQCKSSVFDKSAVVFDAVTICATSGVPQNKLEHAAGVAAQWLDNDQDGQVDDPVLLAKLQERQPRVLMTENGIGLWVGLRSVLAFRSIKGLQDLGAQETAPSSGGRDAAPEEIHHSIMNNGWQQGWPETFSDKDTNSIMYKQWEKAEAENLYSYNDPTCDSACKVTEFSYLASAAYLHSEPDLANDEIRIDNRAELAELLPQVTAVFESNDYVYPTHMWPDGNYQAANNIVYHR